MRIVVVGATGNVGTSLISALECDPEVTSIVGVARREPSWRPAKVEWRTGDVRTADLVPMFSGADAVVHLAWIFGPTHDPAATWQTNVIGSTRVFRAAAEAGVSTLICASSVGAYSPGPQDRAIDESWPTHGWPGAAYSREKAYVERLLDSFEREHPGIRVVRMRPAFIVKRESATEQWRLFAGPLMPQRVVRPGLIVPDIPGMRFQLVHTADAAEAYRLVLRRPVSGAFNIAADPVIDGDVLAEMLRARRVRVPAWLVRGAVAAGWQARLIPAAPGMVDLLLRLPIMDTTRARTELGWRPRYSATEALREVLDGLRGRAGMETPPLSPEGGVERIKRLVTGVGSRLL
ncbi:NAD-dependent epimerase [Thermobispora bispora]|uniref:NAD-dependent epimerase/dehydratase n=1 Tax=Thermobispora bispora (strain ATCC 19993 / DSM 43833 / CBS 139.67 / JCM 10125 / KCTC 9307 / NBRC 14880 / R51) TaxID=469371 RepID=D6YAD7_THEBD|nr:NAD-dependent epimerase/dehydratase family protein [Thermobispora bispora]ADG90190.1 NAD-dependent epimerase/dehydratase [Thermobispora bispora DSM 43833]